MSVEFPLLWGIGRGTGPRRHKITGGLDVSKTNPTLQDGFLNQLRKESTQVLVYLVNGVQLKGIVRAFDSFTVLLEFEGKQSLVYKHAISTIIPGAGFREFAGKDGAAEARGGVTPEPGKGNKNSEDDEGTREERHTPY